MEGETDFMRVCKTEYSGKLFDTNIYPISILKRLLSDSQLITIAIWKIKEKVSHSETYLKAVNYRVNYGMFYPK